eukprot:2955058-Prymnesium_polylepis.1
MARTSSSAAGGTSASCRVSSFPTSSSSCMRTARAPARRSLTSFCRHPLDGPAADSSLCPLRMNAPNSPALT